MTHKKINFETDIEFSETDSELILSLPHGHGYIDIKTFYWDMFTALSDVGFEINGYEHAYLFIRSYPNIYDGAAAFNIGVWNAIFDLYKHGHTTLQAVAAEDIEETTVEWFN